MKRIRREGQRIISLFLALLMVFGCLSTGITMVDAATDDYEIYPKPHSMDYQSGEFIIHQEVNLVYETGIDDDTKARMNEVLQLKQIHATESNEIDQTKTNILVGIKNSGEYVDKYGEEHFSVNTSGLYKKGDAYQLVADKGIISILGLDSDAAFYGITSLYHIVKQMDSYTIRNFVLEDYSDVASRGFIEGYYGNPWSTEDRAKLMEWGGYYKLNSYFYAPKDDPKHNSSWRELYTDEEIETKIKPLAEAGNKSKCRFVFALHPYMHNAISYTSEESYQADLKVMQAKFAQVIAAGVRQIAILADDAGSVGGANYIKTLEDMTDWLKEMKKTYPDLKLTLPFVTVEYGGYGEGYYANFPDNVQIVMTGGRIWGEASTNFTETFTKNVGRGPYLWINWPCTDNSKSHLIMGGYDTFLHPGVDPANIQGIVLNPMQQSEPSKVAIFGNACYTWNIWDSKEEADQAWHDSFKYVDHNSAIETPASNALRELSKHMINQNMDGRVTALQESVDLKEKLNAFKDALSKKETISEATIDDLVNEFTILQNATSTYRTQAGDTRIRDQIVYWLNCYDDTTTAAIAYLAAIKADSEGDTSGLLSNYAIAQKAFAKSKTYGFNYIDHNEYAEVGVQHIVPFIKAMDSYLNGKVASIADPNVVIKSYISKRYTKPSTGDFEDLFDNNDATAVQFTEPNYIKKDDYFGVSFNKGITVNSIRIAMGDGKNHFYKSKLEYTTDGTTWKEVSDVVYDVPKGSDTPIEISDLNLKDVKGVRLLSVEDNGDDSWLLIKSIDINNTKVVENEKYEIAGITKSDNIVLASNAPLTNATDGDSSSEVWLKDTNTDTIPADASVTVDLGTAKSVGEVTVIQDTSSTNKGDILDKGVIEYSLDGTTWKKFGDLEKSNEQVITATPVTARYIRVRNTEAKGVWWRLAEIQVSAGEEDNSPINYGIIKTSTWTPTQGTTEANLYDGNDDTYVWYDPDSSSNRPTNADAALVNDYLGYDLGKVATLASTHIVVGNEGGDKLINYCIETSTDGENWTPVSGYKNYTGANSGKDVLDIDLKGTQARYIRIRNLTLQATWVKFSEFTVKEVQGGQRTNLYTNVQTSILANVNDLGDETSLTSGNVTLAKNDYIGVKLNNIKEVNKVSVDVDSKALTLQGSQNGIIWQNIDSDEVVEARYIRLINLTDKEIQTTLNEFKVTSNEVYPFSLYSCDVAAISSWGDTRDNGLAFDGDVSTTTKIGGNPYKGQSAIFDLGQSVSIKSLRTYVSDSQIDFIRDASIQVSDDLENWQTAFEIGDGITDTDRESAVRDSAVYQNVDSNYPNVRYEGNDNLNLTGRYIRVLFTADFPTRGAVINEFIINGGAYLPVEINKDYAGDLEQRGYQPSFMNDGSIKTTYKGSNQNSEITYRISEPEGIKSFRVIQSGLVEGAVVKARLYDQAEKTETLVTVGTLNQAINEFVVPDGKSLLAVNITWRDEIPEIAEIIKLDSASSVDKTALKAKIDELKNTDTSSWTTSSAQKFISALAIANEAYTNEYISNESVSSALASLVTSYNGRVEKYDVTSLQSLVDNAISNENGLYSMSTYRLYSYALSDAKTALTNKDNLDATKGEAIYTALANSINALEYSVGNRELAQIALENISLVNADNYTTNSIKAFTDAKEALTALIEQDINETRVHPDVMKEATNKLKQTYQALVDVTTLKAAINEFDKIDKTMYSTTSYQAYLDAINEAKKVLVDGNDTSVAKALEKIDAAKGQLKFVSEVELSKAIETAKGIKTDLYAKVTVDQLTAVVKEAENNLGISDAKNKEYTKKINEAMNALVNIEAITNKLAQINAMNLTKYTQKTVTKLNEAVASVNKEKDLATTSAIVNDLVNQLNDAVSGLKLVSEEVDAYLQQIELADSKLYQEDSYQAYLKAYKKLTTLGDDVSEESFIKAKQAYEKALANLEYLDADYQAVEAAKKKVPSDLSGYTAESVAKLNAAINSVEYGLTIVDQAKVDQSAKAIEDAIAGLVKKVVIAPTPVPTPEGTKTGDEQMILPFIGLGLLGLAGLWIYRKKEEI